MIRDCWIDDDGRVRVWRPCERGGGTGGQQRVRTACYCDPWTSAPITTGAWDPVVVEARQCPDCGGRGERPC